MSTLLSHSLAWALLYSLWQGLLLYGLLFVLLKAMPDISARVKYNLALGSFAALFIWFADTWFAQYQKLKGSTVYVTAPAAGNASETMTFNTVIAPYNDTSLLHRLLPDIQQYYPLIMLLYSLGLAFMVFRFIVNIGQVRALRTQGIAIPAKEWADFVAKWQGRFNISSPVQLFLSNRISVPMMMGAVKPIILLPIATINHLSTEQVEAILLHELAHIRRHDYIVNMLQTIGETLLFFNPFVWLISSVIRKEREHCCDDLVVESAADPLPYARALAILETNRLENNLAIAATGNKNQLFNRIKRIMEMKKNNLTNSQLTIIVVAILAITFSVAMFTFTPSFAQKTKKEKHTTNTTDTSSPKKIYKHKIVVIDANGGRTEDEHGSFEPVEEKEPGSNKVVIKYREDNDKTHKGGHVYTRTYVYDSDSPGTNKTVNISVANTDDIMNEVEKAMVVVHKELKDMDWVGMYDDIEKALAEVDKEITDPKLRKKIKAEIEKELENARKEMKHAKVEMHQAHKEMDKAKEELKKERKVIVKEVTAGGGNSYSYDNNDIENMLDEMEQAKLIDRSRSFEISKAGDVLTINGEKQPAEVLQKYKKYLGSKTMHINGKKDNLNINISN